ncbi:MAG TPA: DUF3096 domain-containing protein [Methylobacter sp.]
MYVNTQALLSLIAGILILVRPALLNYIIAIYLNYRRRFGFSQMISLNVKNASDILDFHRKHLCAIP